MEGYHLKFNDMNYQRPNLIEIEEKMSAYLESFKTAQDVDEQLGIIEKINDLRNYFEGMWALARIRHTLDTTQSFYKDEQDFYDQFDPVYKRICSAYYEALVSSPYRQELEGHVGKQLFSLAELNLKTYSPEVEKDLQEENRLVSQYLLLLAQATVTFEGEEKTLSQMMAYTQSDDRDLRKKASEARTAFFEENEEALDQIFDQLVKVRTSIAHELGFNSFVELGYARMCRTDYDASMVRRFRDQILDLVVPITSKLKERQRERIGLEKLEYYDQGFLFQTGNPTPKGGPDWILHQGENMYQEMSSETDEFFQFMMKNNLIDVVSRQGKRGGGYCDYMHHVKSPFIFSNFNGTSGDIDVLTHEVGHAFQVYQSRHFDLPEYNFPTFESGEIHSMSMEYLAWPWMEHFFKEDTEKYKYTHLEQNLYFLPYGVCVDEFQHIIYANPEMTVEERKQAWRKLEKQYLPYKDYKENDYLERGNFWHQQRHIFFTPFYYIDYALAQICALQFWKKTERDNERKQAWQDYLAICQVGGSLSFLQLIALADLDSPFDDGCVKSIIRDVENWLDQVNDLAL